jgi:MFS family permease
MEFLRRVRDLPPQIWLALLLHTLDSYASFAISTNLTLFLITEFEIGDVNAGLFYSLWGAALVLVGVPLGFVIDKIGLRRSLLIGTAINAVARVLFALSGSAVLSGFALLFGMSVGSGFMEPVLHIIVDSYSRNKEENTLGFSLVYTTMNIGAVLAMLSTDWALSRVGGFHFLFGLSALISVVEFVVSFLFRENRRAAGDLLSHEHLPPSSWRAIREVLTEGAFWRLVLLTLLLTGARAMFRHWETLLPNWLVRVYPGIEYGTVLSLNPLLIILATPILGSFASDWFTGLQLIMFGSLLSALSPVFPWFWISSSYAPILASILLFTVGEALYSPRVNQLIVNASPLGKKGAYSGLIPIAQFAGTLFSGTYSGWLLDTYCPAVSDTEFNYTRDEHCSHVWGWIIISALTSPLLMVLFYRVLLPLEGVREESTEASVAALHSAAEAASSEEEEGGGERTRIELELRSLTEEQMHRDATASLD